jgi:hypothetical protein
MPPCSDTRSNEGLADRRGREACYWITHVRPGFNRSTRHESQQQCELQTRVPKRTLRLLCADAIYSVDRQEKWTSERNAIGRTPARFKRAAWEPIGILECKFCRKRAPYRRRCSHSPPSPPPTTCAWERAPRSVGCAVRVVAVAHCWQHPHTHPPP